MALTRLLLGLWATAHGFLGPVAAPRRAAPLHVIETEPSTDEKEIFSETSSISGALAELWQVLANPPPPGDFRAMYFPQCEGLKRPQTFQALFEHLEVCKDSSQKCSCGVLLFSSRCSRRHRVPRPRRVDGATCHAIDAMPHAALEPTSTPCLVPPILSL